MARALKQLQQLGSVFATSWSWRQYRILQPEPMADPFFYWWQTLGLVIQSHIFIQAGVTGWLSDQDQSETKYLVIRFSIWILSQLLSVKCCTFTQKAMRRADHFKNMAIFSDFNWKCRRDFLILDPRTQFSHYLCCQGLPGKWSREESSKIVYIKYQSLTHPQATAISTITITLFGLRTEDAKTVVCPDIRGSVCSSRYLVSWTINWGPMNP